ncbi:ASCH domain-containing protein [Hymenobacter humi]|uniref:ASCH domain-containing protein n=1 Tax=Hymenobacter humi TaxID=1411620 RepID=A0ABW2UEA6_9BACT
MRVLLSIKPEFASKIFDGTKRYEFRRSIFKNANIKSIVVYASSPTQKVIGEFEIERIINTDLVALWHETKEFSGITEDYFMKYFIGKEEGFAIKIKKVKKYKEPMCIRADFQATPLSLLFILTRL